MYSMIVVFVELASTPLQAAILTAGGVLFVPMLLFGCINLLLVVVLFVSILNRGALITARAQDLMISRAMEEYADVELVIEEPGFLDPSNTQTFTFSRPNNCGYNPPSP